MRRTVNMSKKWMGQWVPGSGVAPSARRAADAVLAALVVLMVGMMIVPLPTVLLDMLIATNIALAVMMLLVSLTIRDGLQFASFPTVLLITTLFRLALNVSSTRLILLQADAGDVISAFGNFVVQGNYVVGAVVFLILTLIQFIVVAKGSERVAEVGARFTLDAMPGKQMSIDAELRAGTLDASEARSKRLALQRESEFFGSMDGAMKFVKGDSIAGIVITLVNIVGGLAIGVLQRGMDAGDALALFGLLTIGDGLVSQIPSLLISTAAGLVVTRVSAESDSSTLGGDIAKQIFSNTKALRVAAGFLALLAVVPGLPTFPFLVLAGLTLLASSRAGGGAALPGDRGMSHREAGDPDMTGIEEQGAPALVPLMMPLVVQVSDGGFDDAVQGPSGPLHNGFMGLRTRLFMNLGLPLPPVRIRRSTELGPGQYRVELHEVAAGHGQLHAGHVMADCPAEEAQAQGIDAQPAIHPVTLMPACWVPENLADAARELGAKVTDGARLLEAHVDHAIRRRAEDFLGIHEVQMLLDQLEGAYPSLVRQVIPKPVPLTLLTAVLRRLVDEGVSIRPLREILEALATFVPNERDPMTLAELVRTALKRHISHQHAVHHGTQAVLKAVLVDPIIEEAVRDSVQRTDTGSYVAMPPDMVGDVVEAVRQSLLGTEAEGTVVLLTQTDVRRYLRRLLEVEFFAVPVLSYAELTTDVHVDTLARASLVRPTETDPVS